MNEWGGTTKEGFSVVSSAFLRHYAKLGLTTPQAMLVVQILDYHCSPDQDPYPKVETLAERMGMGSKAIRGYIKHMRGLGLLRTRRRMHSQEYNFGPLMTRLSELCGIDFKDPVSDSESVQKSRDPEPAKVSRRAKKGIQGSANGTSEGSRETTLQTPSLDYPLRGEPIEEDEREEDNNTARPRTRKSSRQTKQKNSDPLRLPKKKNGRAKLTAVIDAAIKVAMSSESRRKPANDREMAARRRLRKHQARLPSQYSANDIELVFAQVWAMRWTKAAPPKFTLRDKRHAKDLIEQYGAAETAQVIREVITHWDKYRKAYNLNGHPSMRLFYGWRITLFAAVLEEEINRTEDQGGSQFHEDHDREEGDEIGWGF